MPCLVASLWPAKEKGSFDSRKDEPNATWNTAVATLRSIMHHVYLDGIYLDGLHWHDGPLTLVAYERVCYVADLPPPNPDWKSLKWDLLRRIQGRYASSERRAT